MQVFRDAVERNGGPLPLAYYLQPDAGGTPDAGAPQYTKPIDLLNTCVDRRTFFECLLHDKDFAVLNTFLVSGVSANTVRDEDGATALHVATAATLDMLNDGALMNMNDGTGSSSGAVEALEMLDAEEDACHRTDRVLSSSCPNQLILSFLIDNGAEVNAPMHNRLRQTPLMVAAARQNIKVTKLLLARGADVAMEDSAGRTVLSYAARYPLLLEVLRQWMGEEAFHLGAVRERLLHTVSRSVGNHHAALYLIEQVHLNVNGGAESSTTAAAAECAAHHSAGPASLTSPTAEARPLPLLSPRSNSGSSGAAVVAVTASNGCPLPLRPSMGAPATAEMLTVALSSGSHSGDTPLHCAVATGDVALVRALLSKGADVHAPNGSGLTPLRLAQTTSWVSRPMRQYWTEELLLLLQPNSPAAIAARRRRADRQHERSPAKVRALLSAYNNAAPGTARERVLQEPTAQYIWELCAPMDYAQFVATATLPHLFYYLCCCVLRNFFLLLCLLPLLYASFVGMQKRDGHRPRSRPITSFGWCLGFTAAQSLCVGGFTTRYYYQYYSFDFESHAALNWWLYPSAAASAILIIYLVFFSSPGVVTTTEGQRKGIYASLRNAKGTYPKELLYGIDLRTMVKKPLRAQYCVQMQRVVLRFDQYCAYLSTVIGGGNQRVFFWFHVAFLALLSCFYYYAREYGRLMSRVADVAQTSGGAGEKLDPAVVRKLVGTPFSTAGLRFVYMYTQVILPIMILMDVYALYNQLCLIARNLTVFDLEHAEDESSVYCFTLGSTVYTLYDRGMWANTCDFFGWTSFTQVVHRVPKISAYLQNIVEDYQRWQLTGGNGARGCDDQHGHNHGGAAAAVGQQQQHVERIGPQEYGDDEAERTQQMLEAKQRAAFAAAQSAALPALAAATPYACGAPSNSVTNAAAAAAVAGNACRAAGEEEGEEGYEEEEEDQGGGSVLAMHVFQQMVQTGSTDIGRGGGGCDNGGSVGTEAQTQREWDAAVVQARQMYEFYQQSLSTSGQN